MVVERAVSKVASEWMDRMILCEVWEWSWWRLSISVDEDRAGQRYLNLCFRWGKRREKEDAMKRVSTMRSKGKRKRHRKRKE